MTVWREMLNAECPKRDGRCMTAATWCAPICRRYCEADGTSLKRTWSVAEGSQPQPTPRDAMPYHFHGGFDEKAIPRKRLAGRTQRGWLSAGGRHAGQGRPVPPPAVYSWSGCYGGGFVGYGWGNSQHRSLDPRRLPGFEPTVAVCRCRRVAEPSFRAFSGDITPSFDMSGALGGFNFGCQAQFGWWLIGIEGDGAVTNKDGQAFNNFLGFVDPPGREPDGSSSARPPSAG